MTDLKSLLQQTESHALKYLTHVGDRPVRESADSNAGDRQSGGSIRPELAGPRRHSEWLPSTMTAPGNPESRRFVLDCDGDSLRVVHINRGTRSLFSLRGVYVCHCSPLARLVPLVFS